MKTVRILLTLLCGVAATQQALGRSPDHGPQAAAERQAVAGEVIVKFAAGSEAGRVAAMALRDDAAAGARATALAASLSEQLSLPLEISRITSGQEFVVSVDAEALTAEVVERLRRHGAARAEVLATGAAADRLRQNPRILVEFAPDSEQAGELSAALAGTDERDAALRTFAQHLEDELEVRLAVESLRGNQVVLVLDVAAATADLVERLEARDDVEYAQPNFLLQPFRSRTADSERQGR